MWKIKQGGRIVAMSIVLAMIVVTVSPFAHVRAASSKVKLNKKKLNVGVGGSAFLTLTGKKIKSVSWKSSNRKIAAVKKKGLKRAVITGKKVGKVKVKAVVKMGNKKKKVLSCTVSVKKAKKSTVTMNPPASRAPETVPSTALPSNRNLCVSGFLWHRWGNL